jgi:uncharacterized protein YecE (DUF72 family)
VVVSVGTSGWQYRHWRDGFYPAGLAAADWLAFYAQRFSSVEVNASFYRLPKRETVERWAATVPDGFVLTFKASRYVTHVRRLRDCAEPLERMRAVFEGAGTKLGPVLFQLPPTLRVDEPLLRDFLGLLPSAFRAAIEFRHQSWLTEGVLETLDASGAALVHADRPGVRVSIPTLGGWAIYDSTRAARMDPAIDAPSSLCTRTRSPKRSRNRPSRTSTTTPTARLRGMPLRSQHCSPIDASTWPRRSALQ